MRMAMGQGPAAAVGGLVKDTAILKLVGPTAIWAGGTLGVLRTMERIVKQSGVLERGLHRIATMQGIESKFEGLLKSATRAKAKMQELNSMSMSMPFRSDEVAEAALILERLTKGAYAGAEALREVGDVAAATGNSLTDTATGVGKLMAAINSGRPLERMLFQMQQTGMVTDELATKLERLEGAGLLRSDGKNAIREHFSRYKGGMANDMKNLDTLKIKEAEASTGFDAAFGAAFTEAKVKAYESSTRALQNMTPIMAALGKEMAPLVTVTDTIKHKLVDMALGTQVAQKAALEAVPVFGGLVMAIAAMSGAGVVGHLGNALGRYATQKGARDTTRGLVHDRRMRSPDSFGGGGGGLLAETARAISDRAMDSILADSDSGPRKKIAAKLRKFRNTGARAWDTLQEVHETARARMGQRVFDPRGGMHFGGSGIGRYAATWAAELPKMLLGLAKGVGRMLLNVMAANIPLILGAVAIMAAAKFLSYANECKRAVQAQLDLRKAVSESNTAMREQLKYASSYTEWSEAIDKVYEAKRKLATLALSGKNEDGSAFTRDQMDDMGNQTQALNLMLRDALAKRPNFGVDDAGRKRIEDDVARKEQLKQANDDWELGRRSGGAWLAYAKSMDERDGSILAEVRKVREDEDLTMEGRNADRRRDIDRALSGAVVLDPNQEAEMSGARALLEHRRDAALAKRDELAFKLEQSGYAPGSAGFDMRMAQVREQAGLAERAIAGHDRIRGGYLSETQVADLKNERRDLEDNRGVIASLEAKRVREGSLSKGDETVLARAKLLRDSEASLQQGMQARNQARRGKEQEALLSEYSLEQAERALRAREIGGRTAGIERLSELGRLSLEEGFSRKNGDPLRADDLAMQQMTIKANEAAFSITSKLEELANGYILGGDKKGAQRVRDWQDRESLRSEFERNGMTSAQADEAFAQRLRAGAAGMLPSIQADSLQALGGGGAFYAGADPMKSVQDRIASLSSEHVEVSRQILSAIQSTQRMQ